MRVSVKQAVSKRSMAHIVQVHRVFVMVPAADRAVKHHPIAACLALVDLRFRFLGQLANLVRRERLPQQL
jgi:hypothetical protein